MYDLTDPDRRCVLQAELAAAEATKNIAHRESICVVAVSIPCAKAYPMARSPMPETA